MNIHINKNQFEFILANTKFDEFIIGSRLYGLNDENSDIDILIVYHPFYNQLIDPFNNHHQFQYKDEEKNVDYNLVDAITFIKNLVSGDSTINFEVIFSDEIKYSCLSFLYFLRNEFLTFNIAKAYLGFAKRDVKSFNKRTTYHDKISGYLHIKRSIYIATAIIEGDLTDLKPIYDKLKIDKELIKKTNEKSLLNLVKGFDSIINDNRNLLTDLHNKNKITKFLKPDVQNEILRNLERILIISEKSLPLDQIHFHNENIEFKY